MSDLRPRRSVLYMPAANERALEKAKSIPAMTPGRTSGSVTCRKVRKGLAPSVRARRVAR